MDVLSYRRILAIQKKLLLFCFAPFWTSCNLYNQGGSILCFSPFAAISQAVSGWHKLPSPTSLFFSFLCFLLQSVSCGLSSLFYFWIWWSILSVNVFFEVLHVLIFKFKHQMHWHCDYLITMDLSFLTSLKKNLIYSMKGLKGAKLVILASILFFLQLKGAKFIQWEVSDVINAAQYVILKLVNYLNCSQIFLQ